MALTEEFSVPVQWVIGSSVDCDMCLEKMNGLTKLHALLRLSFPPWDPEDIVERVVIGPPPGFSPRQEFLTLVYGVEGIEGDTVVSINSFDGLEEEVRAWFGFEGFHDPITLLPKHRLLKMPEIDYSHNEEEEGEEGEEEERETLLETTLEALPLVSDLTKEFVAAWTEVDDGGVPQAVASLVTLLSQASVMAEEGVEWTDPDDLDEVVKDKTVRYGVLVGLACSIVMKVIKKDIQPSRFLASLQRSVV